MNRRDNIHSNFILLTLVVMAGLCACGYSSPYSQSSIYDKDQDGQVTIYLQMWNNKTNLLGYQATIQQALTHRLKQSHRFILTQQRLQADFILSGQIHSVDIPGLAYGDYDRASEVRINTILSYQLKDNHSNKVIMSNNNLAKTQTATVGSNSIRTRNNQQTALATMADSLADQIYIQLFYLFTRNDLDADREVTPTNDITTLE